MKSYPAIGHQIEVDTVYIDNVDKVRVEGQARGDNGLDMELDETQGWYSVLPLRRQQIFCTIAVGARAFVLWTLGPG